MLDFIQTPRLTVARLFSFLSSKFLDMSNSNCSCYGELNLFLFTSNSTVLCKSNSTVFLVRRTQFVLDTSSPTLQWVYSILQQVSSILSASLLNSAARPLNSGSFNFLPAYIVKSSVSSFFHFCILHEEFRYFTLHSVQEHHCILCQESTLLCRLWTLH